MCGIAGAIGIIDEQVSAGLARAGARQQHRGPDAEGAWRGTISPEQAVEFVHRRLAIIDLRPEGNQPMVDADTGCAICFNGEIYNFQELRGELEGEGASFRTRGDTEVLLKGFAHWGRGVLERVRGMFAVALWDPRSRRLLLARDHYGQKPLYYGEHVRADGRRTFVFASELRALLATDLFERRIDPVGLRSYLWNGAVNDPATLIRGIHMLPSGACMEVGADGTAGQVQCYWQLPPTSLADEARAVGDLKHALQESVRMHLVSDAPLGVFLSGGIDSSAVAAMAMQAGGDPVNTFNISFDESEYDESVYAKAVAGAIGSRHHEIRLTQRDFVEHLDEALEGLDQPTFEGINTYFVSRAVAEAGLKVALAGTGGDELFGGYRSFRDIPAATRWSKRVAAVPEPLLSGGVAVATRAMVGRAGVVPPQTRWGKLKDVINTRGGLIEAYQVSYGLFTRQFLQQLIAPCDQVHYGLSPEGLAELEAVTRGEPALPAISNLEACCFLRDRLLRVGDSASMAVSIEMRLPLLDREIAAALSRITPHRRFHPLGRKQLLRDVALSHLDPRLFEREKRGFVFPIDRWARQTLAEQIDQTFHDARLCDRVGISSSAVRGLWDAFRAGAPGIYWSRIWTLYVLLWWCERNDAEL